MARNFDLIVVGGGSGGLAGAFRAAEHGASVALLEPGALGGTCVNAGCVPKKAMWLAADVARKLTMAGDLGFATETCALDWPEFIAHRQRYINNIHESYRRRLDEAGIAVLPMRGRLTGPGTVECQDGVSLSASRVLLATGAHAIKPPIPGAELGATSDDFFHWRAPPAELAIVGGGYVAVELAGVMQALGSRVSMFVRGPRLLEAFDAELCDRLAEDYRHAGVRLHFDCEVEAVEGEGGRFRIRGGGQDQGMFDTVLFATGRAPNTDGLGLDAVGVDTDDRGRIRIDDTHATSARGVYAVGDATTDPALTPVAIAAARRLMDRLYAGRDATLDLSQVPTVVFAHPPLGKVGLTEAEARAKHDDVQVYTSGFRPMLHALAESEQRSLFKLVCVGEDRRVIGLHLLGDAADEILQGYAVAIRRGITLDDLHDTIAIHPTSAEEVVLLR